MKIICFLISFLICACLTNRLSAQAPTDPYKLALADYKKSEKDMNTLYNRMLKIYAGDSIFLIKLKESQRIWLLLRDANMEMIFPDHKKGKDEYGPLVATCKLWELKDMVDERSDFLNQWVDGIDEETDCVGSRKVARDE